MKNIKKTNLYGAVSIVLFLLLATSGCDPFYHDGITSPDINNQKGYFYILDRGEDMLVMLDYGMHELKRWSLRSIAPDTVALQGMTFAGKNVWLALSGNEKFIAQIDATADTLVVIKKIPVPPVVAGSTQGTVRGIAYDGQYMWAVNSGSAANTVPSTLFKIDMTKDSAVSSYLMPVSAPRGITYANIPLNAYGKGPGAGLYFLDNTTKMIHYFNNKVPFFDTLCAAPVPPAGTTYDQTLGITNDGSFFYTLSYSDLASYLFKVSYTGTTQFSYKLPYEYPVAVVWANYDIRYITPPSIATISPATGARNTSESVIITGSDFKNGAGLSLSLGQGINVDTLKYLSSTSLYAHLVIDSNAVLGKRNVTVTNPDGRTGTGDSLFTVTSTPVTEYLFVTDVAYDSLFQIRLKDSVVVQAWSTKSVSPSHPRGLAYDGTNLWISFNSTDYRIYKIDMTGSTLLGVTSFPCPATVGTVQNLSYYNGSLWLLQTPVAAPSRGLIYKLDPATGTVLDTITAPGVIGGRGIAFANGRIYCNDRDSAKVYSCDPAVKNWSYAFPSPPPPAGTTSATGMFFNGTTFWIANSGGTNTASDVLCEVSPAGAVLRYVTAPYPGAAMPQGIVYIAK
jgi:hypothetical protein